MSEKENIPRCNDEAKHWLKDGGRVMYGVEMAKRWLNLGGIFLIPQLDATMEWGWIVVYFFFFPFSLLRICNIKI